MKKLFIPLLILSFFIFAYKTIDSSQSKWQQVDEYTMRYTGNRFAVNSKFNELKSSNKFLYDGSSLITPVLESNVCYFVTNEEHFLELTVLDDCISYNEKMDVVHYYDLLNNDQEQIRLDVTPDELHLTLE